jgi:hypothetical protein
MTIRLYFETLSPGLRAKLDAKYRMTQKPYRTLNPRVIRARFESGGFIPGPVEIVQIPTAQTR